MINFKLVSSYNKCFEDGNFEDYKEVYSANTLKKEFYAFEALVESDEDTQITLKVESDIKDKITVCKIESVNVEYYPQNAELFDEYYLRGRQKGMYPDLLRPVADDEVLDVKKGVLKSFWVEAEITEDTPAGIKDITIFLCSKDGKVIDKKTFKLEVINAVLPEQTLKYTQWFHADCLSSYYVIDVFSERHWEIIENFVKTAVKNGINMLLMPTFTLPLDTEIGGERPTVQLVGVEKIGDDYKFDFKLVDRWLEMCERCGIKYHEVAHLYTQWGALHAPKVMATVDGEYKKIFGWETDSLAPEYVKFVKSFLHEFKAYMRAKGLLDKCIFHLSDEPTPENLETFKAIRAAIAEEINDIWCGEALSSYEFYETGAVKHPIVGTDHIEPFIENKVPELWCYYCCVQANLVSNRFLTMTMDRTRAIGAQMYKYDISGFLQWGYNFYYAQYSKRVIDPYVCNDGGGTGWVSAGDAFSVYPAEDGTPYETLHMKGFTQALCDMRAFALLEKLTSKDEVVKAIEEDFGKPITFKEYSREDDYCEKTRQKINKMIAEKL